MTGEYKKAVDVSYTFECKKDSLKQVQSGDIKVTFTISPVDMPPELYTDAMGQRYVAVIVPVNDDETPRGPERQEKPRQSWGDMQPQQQAGMLCNKPEFREYLYSHYHLETCDVDTKQILKNLLSIESLKDLETDTKALEMFNKISAGYFSFHESPPLESYER